MPRTSSSSAPYSEAKPPPEVAPASRAGTELKRRSLRFSVLEWEHIEHAARWAKLSPSRYVRTTALSLPLEPLYGSLTDAAGYQLVRIATNLGQLLEVAKSAGQPALARIAQALAERCGDWITDPPGSRRVPRPTFDLEAPQRARAVHTVCFTDEDWAALEEEAKVWGLARATYVQAAVLRYELAVYGDCVSADQVEELRGMGRVLNHWTHQANVSEISLAVGELCGVIDQIDIWLDATWDDA